MAITTGGGIGYDRAAFRQQRLQAALQQTMQAANLLDEQRNSAMARAQKMIEFRDKDPEYISNPDDWMAKNKVFLGAFTRTMQQGLGRTALTPQEALSMADQWSKRGAEDPTMEGLNKRALKTHLQGLYNAEGLPPSGGASSKTAAAAPASAAPAAAFPTELPPAPAGPSPAAPVSAVPPGGTVSAPIGIVNLPGAPGNPLAPNGGRPAGVGAVSMPQGSLTPRREIELQMLLPSMAPNFRVDYDKYTAQLKAMNATPEELLKLGVTYGSPETRNYAAAKAAFDLADLLMKSQAPGGGVLPNNAAGSPGPGSLSPEQLAQHEARTGDIHYPALVGVKEGIVNARAMEAGGDRLVAALNQQYPVFAEGKSPSVSGQPGDEGPPPMTPEQENYALKQLAQQQRIKLTQQQTALQDMSQRLTQGQQMSVAAEQPMAPGASTGGLQQSATEVQAASKAPGSKGTGLKDFGKGIAEFYEHMTTGPGTRNYRAETLAKRDVMMIGKMTVNAFESLPAETREAILNRVDAALQARSPEFLASMAGSTSETMSLRRSEAEARKIQTLQSMASMMSSTSKQMSDLLEPMTRAFSELGNLQKIVQQGAAQEKMTYAKYLEKNDGLQSQLNSWASLIETFGRQMGISLNLQTEITKGGLFNTKAFVSPAGPDAVGAPAQGNPVLNDLVNQYSQ